MRRRRWIGLVVGVGLVAASIAAAAEKEKEAAKVRSPEVQRIVSAAREGSKVMEHLDVLCNRIGPRLTGSDNLTNACEWVRDRFAEFGIDNARLEQWGEFPVGFNRGPWFGRVVEPEAKGLEFVTMAWSAGTKGAVRGKAVLAPKDKRSSTRPRRRGRSPRWVLMPPPPGPSAVLAAAVAARPPRRQRPRRPRSSRPRSPRPRRPTRSGLPPGSARSWRRPKRGRSDQRLAPRAARDQRRYRINWDKLPTLPSVTLLRKQYDEIAGWLKAGKPVTLEFDIRNHFKKGPIKLYNVIADIPGTEKPDEYVIVGGHIDSWDGATGATDNGTGVSTAIEAARILMKAGVRPKRTIRFMLWSGEEQGLLGSAAYVKAHKDLMPKISAVLVHDGGTNYLSGIGGTEAMMADFEQVFAPIKELDPTYPFEVTKVVGLRGGGSDHASFLSADVPGFFWRQAGKAVYNHTHHTQFDTYDAAVPEYQVHSSLVVALGAYGIADLDHLLSREKLRAPGGSGNRRSLGVQLEDMTVSEVIDEGVAQKGGIKEGDTLLKIDGTPIGDDTELRRVLQAGGPKKVVTVLRNGKELELKLDWEPAATPR